MGVAKVLLGHFRDGTHERGDDIDLIVETVDRVAKVVEGVRRLTDWLEFGVPGHDTRREIANAQRDIYACELRYFAGLTWPEVAERLGFDTSSANRRAAAMRAKSAAERGERLFLQGWGPEMWAWFQRVQKREYQHYHP